MKILVPGTPGNHIKSFNTNRSTTNNNSTFSKKKKKKGVKKGIKKAIPQEEVNAD